MLLTDRLPGKNFCYYHRHGALPAIAVAHPAFSASVLLQGAQLVDFTPAGEPNWLWLSEDEPFVVGRAVRGGIPICWPWFGEPHRNPKAIRKHIQTDQAHGLVRDRDWRLVSVQESTDSVQLVLALDTAQLPAESWSGRAHVSVSFRFSSRMLAVTLKTTNTDTEALHFSQALHSYYPTADIGRTHVTGLSGEHYVDALDDWQTKLQQGPVSFEAETDRIYTVSGPLQLVTPGASMRLRQTQARTVVIWNPWERKAQRLSHFEPEAWRRMFCVETANALDDAVTLAPGESHTMGFDLSRS